MDKGPSREPPAAMKPLEKLTDADRSEMRGLGIGEGDFNRIVTSCVKFTYSDGWNVRKRDSKYNILWETKPSENSNKQAMRFTVNVPHCNSGSLEAIIVDDKHLEDDPNTSYVYKYDMLLQQNRVEKFIAGNVVVQCSKYRAPVPLVAPRQMVMYVTLGALLTPAQQQKLGIRPTAFSGQLADSERTDNLMAFAQCGIDYTGEEVELKKGVELGHVHYYMMLGQEEPDGSMTLTMSLDMDPAGRLPAKVVDLASEEQLRKMQLIVDLLKEKGPRPHLCSTYENTREFPFRSDLM
ncbi:hypothetical protein LSCM1_02013 [Leishmania martiniquensis]|uniref:Uncharacterized protein n=1 Tax=Leishmania martiniquensis TaxID=1580590 RepID=A0A836KBY8_9TRYP|nr:hypothetical protein LSCM1_02013 [Leishmania martiniquensis]